MQLTQVIGRLKPGVTLEEARADLTELSKRANSEIPATFLQMREGMQVQTVWLHDKLVGDVRPTLMILLIAVGVVLTVVFGALATYLSGEYVETWAFILLDMAWVGGIGSNGSGDIFLAFSTSNRATSSCRQLIARCSGVSPLRSAASMAAPQSSNARAIPAWPRRAAMCSAVSPWLVSH